MSRATLTCCWCAALLTSCSGSRPCILLKWGEFSLWILKMSLATWAGTGSEARIGFFILDFNFISNRSNNFNLEWKPRHNKINKNEAFWLGDLGSALAQQGTMLLYEMNEAVDLTWGEDILQTLSTALVDFDSECAVEVTSRSAPYFQAFHLLNDRCGPQLFLYIVQ